MTRQYKVAEHIISVSLMEDSLPEAALRQYAPFAVEVASEEPLVQLEQVAQLPDLSSMEVVYDPQTQPGEPVVKLYRHDAGLVVLLAPDCTCPTCGTLLLSDDYRRGSLRFETEKVSDRLFALNNALMVMFAFAGASRGTLEIHASVIVCRGHAYPFLAASGTGKSTHSSLWLRNVPGSRLLNDDNPVLRVWPDGRAICYGSPWSGKTPCYRNESAPLGAMTRIRRCGENRITRLGLVEAYALLLSGSSGFKADEAMSEALHKTVSKVVGSVPFYVMDCRPDDEAALVCSKELLGIYENK